MRGASPACGACPSQTVKTVMMKRSSSRLRLHERARSANAARGGGQGPQGPKRNNPSPFNWEHHLHMLSPAEFKTHYRLEAFTDLVEMLRPMLEATNKKQAARTRRGEFIQETHRSCEEQMFKRFANLMQTLAK